MRVSEASGTRGVVRIVSRSRVKPPSAAGGSTTAGMQEVEQRREQLPREARHLIVFMPGVNNVAGFHNWPAFFKAGPGQSRLGLELFWRVPDR